MAGSRSTGIRPPARSVSALQFLLLQLSALRTRLHSTQILCYFSVTQARASISSSILFDLAGSCACIQFRGSSLLHLLRNPSFELPLESRSNCLFAQGSKEESAMVQSLSLQDFLLRARVLKLYRHALRIARRAPDPSGAELRQTIRQEIDNNRNCNDRQRIRFLLSDGVERVKNLDEMLDMQGH